MKTLSILLLVLSLITSWGAEPGLPQIVCRDARGQSFPLKLERFAMIVSLHEDLAETTLTLTFRNETPRQLEGDFLLPLPPNAQISGYALEVNGSFREAVAVEKERAKLAYESIKRRGIDPGIVEKEADNLYRTRIFPIERNSTKSLRISYLEYLPLNELPPCSPVYRYPFNFTSPVGEISVRIQRGQSYTVEHPSLEFLSAGNGTKEAMLKNATLDGMLELTAAKPHQSRLLFSEDAWDKRAYLTISPKSVLSWRGTAEEPVAPVWETPQTINLLWDAPRSRAGSNHTPSFEYLEAFFAQVPQVNVKVYLLRNTVERLNDYKIAAGNWATLKADLENVEYDGSSSFTDTEQFQEQFSLFFTDGKVTQWADKVDRVTASHPLIALLSNPLESAGPTLKNLVNRSGGQVISLAETSTEQALKQTFQQSFHPWSSERRIKFVPLPSRTPYVYRYLVEGYNANSPKTIEIAVGQKTLGELEFKTRKAPSRLLSRLAGTATLALLEDQEASPSEIIAHCKEHTLVSDYTSLIVLERFEDHLTFRIPPPEADLLARYERMLAERKIRPDTYFRELWAEALRRHRHQYPGVDVVLQEPYSRFRTLRRAQEQVFSPEALDPELQTAFQNWEQEVKSLSEKIATEGESEDLIKQTLDLKKQASELGQRKAKAKVPFEVSMRGEVLRPQTLSLDEPTSLQEALALTEPREEAFLASVAFYRSGTKTVYNTLSKQFEDFPLLPGDMVVLENPYTSFYHGFGDDPFSSEESSDPDFSSQPAVVAGPANDRMPTSVPRGIPATLGDLNAGASDDSFGGSPIRARHSSLPKASTRSSELDPIPIALRAMELFKEEKKEEAQRHLSNLRELFPKSTAALRLEAYVHSQWGQSPEKAYRFLLEKNPEDHLTALFYADYLLAKEQEERAKKVYETYFGSLENRASFLTALALVSDRNRLLENVSGTAEKTLLPKDLRVVVTNLHPDPSFRIILSDPLGIETGKNQVSATGVASTGGVGITEFTDRDAIQGTYFLKASCQRQQLLEVVIYRDFAGENEVVTRDFVVVEAEGKEQVLKSIVMP